MTVEVEYEVTGKCEAFHGEVIIKNWEGMVLANNATTEGGKPLAAQSPVGRFQCCFPRLPLVSGSYLAQINLMDETGRVFYDIWQGIYRPELAFAIRPNAKSIALEQYRGIVEMECEWQDTSGLCSNLVEAPRGTALGERVKA